MSTDRDYQGMPGVRPMDAATDDRSVQDKVTDAASQAKDKVTDAASQAKDKVTDVASQVSEKATQVKDKVTEAAAPVLDKVTEASGQAGERINDAMTSTGEQMTNLAQQVRERAPSSGQAGEVAAAAATALERSGDYLQRADLQTVRYDLEGMIRQHPIEALAIGVGLGFLLGRSMNRRNYYD